MARTVKSVWRLIAENRTKEAFNQVRNDLKKTDTAFKGLVVAAGAAGAAAAVGFLVKKGYDWAKNAITSADATAKLATKLGTTTEAISQLNYAADRSGVSSSTLANALRDMGKNAAQAAVGQGEAKAALMELGINAQRFKQIAPEDQLLVMAQALQGVEDPADKTRLAMRVMGESGAEMIKILDQGPDAIRALMTRADELGLTLKGNTAKGAEETVDAFTDVAAYAQVARHAFVKYLGPAIKDIAEVIGNALPKAIFYAGKAFIKMKAWGTDLAGLTYALAGRLSEWASYLPVVGQFFAADAELAAEKAGRLALTADNINKEFEEMTFTTINFSAAVSGAAELTDVLDESLKALAKRQREAAAATKGSAEEQEARRKALEEERKINRAREAIQRRIGQIFEQTRTPVEEYNATLAELLALRKHGLTDDTFARAVIAAQKQMEELTNRTGEASEEMAEFGLEAARNIQDSFSEFLFDPFKGGLKGMLTGFEETLRRMAANEAAKELLKQFGGESGIAGLVNTFFGMIPGRATGGPVAAGVPYWVGEHKRRELFIPATAGRIVPESGGMMQITNNIHINAPGGQVDRRSIQQLQAAVGEATSRALARNR